MIIATQYEATANGNHVVHKSGANANDRSVYCISWSVIVGRRRHWVRVFQGHDREETPFATHNRE